MTIMETDRATGPSLEKIAAADLKVDPVVQRKYDENFAKKIAAEFDMEMLGVLEGSRRADGYVYVTDGQHRRAALMMKGFGDVEIPVIVYGELDTKDEAKKFVARNGANRKPQPVDVFRLRVLAEDVVAMNINRVVERNGCVIRMTGGDNIIAAVGALEWVYNLGGAILLDRVMKNLHDSFGLTRDAHDGQFIKAYGLLIHRRGQFMDMRSFNEKMGKAGTPGRLLGTARSRKMATGKAPHLELVQVLMDAYNKGRTSRKLLPL